MKSYTTIEQSRNLAKILPLESADMYYPPCVGSYSEYPELDLLGVIDESCLPCWSLAALINNLPQFIEFKDDKYYLRFMKDYVEYANDEISLTGRCLHTTSNDNLVDACYEMILKLNELKML